MFLSRLPSFGFAIAISVVLSGCSGQADAPALKLQIRQLLPIRQLLVFRIPHLRSSQNGVRFQIIGHGVLRPVLISIRMTVTSGPMIDVARVLWVVDALRI